jgi:hypothetical protein
MAWHCEVHITPTSQGLSERLEYNVRVIAGEARGFGADRLPDAVVIIVDADCRTLGIAMSVAQAVVDKARLNLEGS